MKKYKALLLLFFVELHLSKSFSAGGGFGSAAASKKKSSTKSPSSSSSTSSPKLQIKTYDLGKDKNVKLYVPPDALNEELRQQNRQKKKSKKNKKKKALSDNISGFGTKRTTTASTAIDLKNKFYGTGDVVWPSSLALARLLAHCPSFVNDRSVLELGCGLGLTSAAVSKHTNAKRLVITDIDSSVLDKAYKSCTELQTDASMTISKNVMDWTDQSTWPKHNDNDESTSYEEFEVLLASDVLYNEELIDHFVNVLKFYLVGEESSSEDEVLKRAIIVDPANRLNRDKFTEVAESASLDVEIQPFPGSPNDFVLINVTPN